MSDRAECRFHRPRRREGMTHEDLGRDAAYARARDGFPVNSSYGWGYADALDGIRAAISVGAVIFAAGCAEAMGVPGFDPWENAARDWTDPAYAEYLTPDEAALPTSTAAGEKE